MGGRVGGRVRSQRAAWAELPYLHHVVAKGVEHQLARVAHDALYNGPTPAVRGMVQTAL